MRTEHLSRVVDGKRLVDDVSLEVQAGDLISIVGPSGAGKSSFLRLLNRLDEPTEGTVFLEGEDYRNIPPRALRRQVGMLMQAPNLFKGTVADNIRFGPRQRGEELSSEAVDRLLRGVNLAGYAGRDVGSLSGGEAQRVSLARTLANSPAMLLLDEPTSSLDEATRRDVEELILQIIDEQALTCLIVTHDQDQARRIARQAAIMEAGRLVRFGPIEEVLGA
ncbi:MAG: phosphate ABC transporter ATP-binding protein [Anaerolineae bacterium]